MKHIVIFRYKDGTTHTQPCNEQAEIDHCVSERKEHAGLVSYAIYGLEADYSKEVTWTAKNS